MPEDTRIAHLHERGRKREAQMVTKEVPRTVVGNGSSAAAGVDGRLVVNPHVQIVRCSDDEVLVKHGTRSLFSEAINDGSRAGILGRLLDRLRRPGTLGDLVDDGTLTAAEAESSTDAVDYLKQRKVLIPVPLTSARAYVDTFLGDQRQLDNAVVGLVGAGVLARRVARGVAAVHPSQLHVLTDGEAVEPHDLVADDGRRNGTKRAPKGVHLHDAAASDETALREIFDLAGYVVVALDRFSPTALHAANAVALATRTPWSAVFFDGSEAVIGPVHVPGETACYFEFEIQHEASLTLKGEYMLYKESLMAGGPARGAPLAPHLDVAAGFAATSALEFILSGTSFGVGRALRINFETGSIDYQDVLRFPRCPACQNLRPPYRHLFL